MKKTYIAIIGKMAAGKGTFCDALRAEVQEYARVMSHRFSDPLNMVLDVLYLPKDRANQQKISTIVRGAFGEEVIGNALKHIAEADNADIIFFDGVRRPQDIIMLRGLPNSHIIAIEAPAEIRFERLKKRADRLGDAEKTWEEFCAESNAESESKIDEIAKEADSVIDNSGTMHDVRKQVREFLQTKTGLVP